MSDPAAEVIAQVFGISPESIHDGLEFHSIPEWDSINHVHLILALEERLGVEIPAHQLIELVSVSQIRKFMNQHGQA